MGIFHKSPIQGPWTLIDSYGFISRFISRPTYRHRMICSKDAPKARTRLYSTRINSRYIVKTQNSHVSGKTGRTYFDIERQSTNSTQSSLHTHRHFHDYFVTHLPSSSLHPDSRSSAGPGHNLPRAASTPHTPGTGKAPAAALPSVSASRDLTVVRIPLKSAKHHFGVSVSRGQRPYNEDSFQAGTIEVPAFAKRAPISLSRKPGGKIAAEEATSADSASGDPQVFFFGVYDGHGGGECSDFLKEELHAYIEESARDFDLKSSLKTAKSSTEDEKTDNKDGSEKDLAAKDKKSLSAIDIKGGKEVQGEAKVAPPEDDREMKPTEHKAATEGVAPMPQSADASKALELESSLVQGWSDTVGGYFRRFKPEFFDPSTVKRVRPGSSKKSQQPTQPSLPITMETVLMYSFLKADFDFVSAQARKPEADSHHSSDAPLNSDEIFGSPSTKPAHHRIGGPTRFKGGSTASVALISTPTPTPFWHPASPSTLLISHVGDTRILLCETATGLAIPMTTDHHPSSPIESSRLRRYAATFVTDSFGEERMSGLANTRAFGDMRSKRIGVSAEPEVRRHELGPAQYSFMVLMSDGISGTLSDQEVVDVVKEARTPDQGARDVVGFAGEVSKDGDNATCLVVRLGGWERRGEGGMGSLGTKEIREFRRGEASDPRRGRT